MIARTACPLLTLTLNATTGVSSRQAAAAQGSDTALPTHDLSAMLRARCADANDLMNAGVQRRDADAATVRALMRERVEPALAVGAVAYGGRDYRLTPADGIGSQASLWRVRYRDAAAATAAERAVAGQRFLTSKFLTVITAARHGDEVIVLLTESAGDAKLVALLGAVARELSTTP